MPHDHHDHSPHSLLPSEPALRVKALETILVEKGLIDPAALDAIIDLYERDIGPQIGAGLVARAWVDPDFRTALLKDADAVITELGHGGRQGEHVVVVENTPDTHNLVVCTLCSCYPWPLLGIPPGWYNRLLPRPRGTRAPRCSCRIRCHPCRRNIGTGLGFNRRDPLSGAANAARGKRLMDEAALAGLVTRDSMIGTGLPRLPDTHMTRIHDMGGALATVRCRVKRMKPAPSQQTGTAALALTVAAGALGKWNIDASRHMRECLPPVDYARFGYYENGCRPCQPSGRTWHCHCRRNCRRPQRRSGR